MPFDISSVQSAMASLQTAGQLVKAILGARDASLIKEKAVELTSVIIDAQSQTLGVQAQLSAAIEEVRELKERIVHMENWTAEKQRYELHQVKPGVLVYAPKESMRSEEPPHQLCATCYQRGVKSILQEEHISAGRTHVLVCHTCNSELITQGLRQDSHQRPRSR